MVRYVVYAYFRRVSRQRPAVVVVVLVGVGVGSVLESVQAVLLVAEGLVPEVAEKHRLHSMHSHRCTSER